jgi:epoxyqueuosine reductase
MQHSDEQLSNLIKHTATELGFDFCGISAAGFLEDEAKHLEEWLKRGYHGEMQWMENHFDKRLDPRLLVDGAKSVISLLYNYYPNERTGEGAPKISKYAYGKDYHKVIKKLLSKMVIILQEKTGDFNCRIFVDSAPVMDKAWAKKSGLGWVGKNTNLIHPRAGSFFFIAEIICDLKLKPDGPIKDYCGTCTRCLDACPTDALVAPYQIDASRCISYLTIEYKKVLPQWAQDKMEGWAYGCDICQDVCPWNRFSKPHRNEAFNLSEEFRNTSQQEWRELTEEVYSTVFRYSAVKRAKYEGFKRNLKFIRF